MKKLAVVALGGNAILRDDQEGTIEEQEQNTFDTLENLVFLLKEGYNLVISHGNGPQVGNILMQNDAGYVMYKIPEMPIDVCVAKTQGEIGYFIERQLKNVLAKHGLERDIITMISQVIVDKDDPAFSNPKKRIGKIYSKDQADDLADKKGWIFKESPKKDGGFRRVVPSPAPVGIMNINTIERMARAGVIIVTAGGGGIPVYIDEKKRVRPSEAVIDKDLASSLLATDIRADEFYILTDVPYIYINYKKPDQEIKEFLNVADTERYLKEGHFGEGNMAPKIRAALSFVKNGGKKSVITEAFKLEDKKYGSKITMEYED